MFGFNWLKPILRKRMKPVPQAKARRAVNNLSLTYAFLGWNFVALLLYLTWKKSIPDGPDKIQKYAEILDIDHARVIKFSGFNKTADYNIDRTEEVMKDKRRKHKVTDLHSPGKQKTEVLENENITQESSTSF